MREMPRSHFYLAALLVGLLAGCSLRVDKGKNGEDQDVSIRLPMGSLHVQKNGTTPQEIGLPVYPGAMTLKDSDGSNSDNVHVGFGDWQFDVRDAKYQTGDPQTKVMAFYREALGRYGIVLECRNGMAVGGEKVTADGLSCEDKHPQTRGVHFGGDGGAVDLRAGSKRHQHMVGLSAAGNGQTAFTLAAIDLPAGVEKKDRQE